MWEFYFKEMTHTHKKLDEMNNYEHETDCAVPYPFPDRRGLDLKNNDLSWLSGTV